MKKVILLLGVFALTACANPKNNSSKNIEEQTAVDQATVGGEKDENGCLTSAGEI